MDGRLIAMRLRLEPEQRSLLADVRRRARTLDQYYAARTLLSLDAGMPSIVVARKFGVRPLKVEEWSRKFRKFGIEYVIAIGMPRGTLRDRRRGSSSSDQHLLREIRSSAPKMSDLVRLSETPSAPGADLDADPADLFRIA